jgi:lauroyl/myristoyl acyltransferase
MRNEKMNEINNLIKRLNKNDNNEILNDDDFSEIISFKEFN